MGVVGLTKVLKGKSSWVSIAPDNKRVIAHARTLKILIAKLKRMGNPDGSITFMTSQKFSSYVGQMKIRYRSHPNLPKILWPVVDVRVTHKHISLPYSLFALVDSGSSISVLHPIIAEALGFDFKKLGTAKSSGLSASGIYKSWKLPELLSVGIYEYTFRFQFTVVDNPDLIWPCILGGDSIFQVARLDFQKFKGYFEIRFRSDIH